jgi:hypothetical protein
MHAVYITKATNRFSAVVEYSPFTLIFYLYKYLCARAHQVYLIWDMMAVCKMTEDFIINISEDANCRSDRWLTTPKLSTSGIRYQ